MKLISLNIELDLHTSSVLQFLKKKNADVICLQELLEEDFLFYKEELDLDGIFQPVGYVKSINYPNIEGKRQGVGIFSKNIIVSGSFFYLGKEENILKPFDEYIDDIELQKNHALVWVNVKSDDDVYKIITTHLPVTEKGISTMFQLEIIDSLISHLNTLGEFVFCGDTNAPRGGEAFDRLTKVYKDNIPSEYKTSIDQNLHRVKGLQHMVDGLFTTSGYQASDVKLMDGVSDHMAIAAEIVKN